MLNVVSYYTTTARSLLCYYVKYGISENSTQAFNSMFKGNVWKIAYAPKTCTETLVNFDSLRLFLETFSYRRLFLFVLFLAQIVLHLEVGRQGGNFRRPVNQTEVCKQAW